jgi:hypothetical protein
MAIKSVASCLILLSIFSADAIAQVSIGVKAGANAYDNYQTGKKDFVSRPNVGLHAGIYGNYVITAMLEARVEALFSTRGSYLKEFRSNVSVEHHRQASYIDFPITASYNIWGRFRLHGGLVPSLFLQEYRSITTDNAGFAVDQGDQLRSYERWQLGFLAGASYDFQLFERSFEGGARGSFGLTRTNELIRDVDAGNNLKYMMAQLYLAYKIF